MDLDNKKWLAIREFCQSCTVPIIGENSEKAVIDGTGVLFKINNRSYLITACHVAKNILQYSDSYGMPVAKSKSGVFSFKYCEAILPKRQQEQKLYDAALIELTKNELLTKHLSENYQFLTIDNIGKYNNNCSDFLLAGYPKILSPNIGNFKILGKFFMLITPHYVGTIDSFIETDADSDIFLDYGKSVLDNSGNIVDAPALEGISGGTIWAINTGLPDKLIWSAQDYIELVGVDVSYCTPSQKYIRGVKWNVVAHLFGEVDPVAKELIIEKMNTTI